MDQTAFWELCAKKMYERHAKMTDDEMYMDTLVYAHRLIEHYKEPPRVVAAACNDLEAVTCGIKEMDIE
jgi:hypothetical protein